MNGYIFGFETSRYAKGIFGAVVSGGHPRGFVLVSAGGAEFFGAVMPPVLADPSPTPLLWVLVPLPLVLLWGIVTFNRLIGCRNRMRNASGGVDVQLKKRHDLIPNLVETVRGYMAHEREVLERVIALRNDARCAHVGAHARLEAEQGIGACIGHLVARAEAYSDLQAGGNFRMLMRSLNEIEEQISASRRSYNAAVERMNNLVEAFPSNLVAGVFGFRVAEFFAAVESERAAPDVGAVMDRSP